MVFNTALKQKLKIDNNLRNWFVKLKFTDYERNFLISKLYLGLVLLYSKIFILLKISILSGCSILQSA